jgi:hypothetical protein
MHFDNAAAMLLVKEETHLAIIVAEQSYVIQRKSLTLHTNDVRL